MELILKAVSEGGSNFAYFKEPKLTKKDVEEMNPETFFTLGAKINELIGSDLKNLENLTKSSEK